ncbi:transcription factor A, mitochondrial-like isoform X2 [Hyperolius riggenbachi]|uniref:transcription factor A, mitochondrial-like isoform X2 n=1 Tax=Hyperolius riggenbachi TaxID=752182 RepID=UPI0035A3393B
MRGCAFQTLLQSSGSAGLPGNRCSSLPSTVSLVQCVTTRCFSKSLTPEELSRTPPIEDPPKRPTSVFMRFYIQQRAQLDKKHPGTSTPDMAKLIGKKWRALSDVEKQIYRDTARADLMKYRESLQTYKDKHGPFELKALKDKRRQKRGKRKACLKLDNAKYGKPKGCRRPLNIFMTEHYHKAKGDSSKEKFKHVSHKWSELPSSDKQVYIKLAEDDKLRYEKEMKVWEDQMIKIGRPDLIRSSRRVILLGIISSKMGEAIKKKRPRKHEELPWWALNSSP